MAIHVQGVIGIVVAVGLGLALYNVGSTPSPLNAFALLGTIATLIVVCIYILTNLANIVFYMRERRSELNILWNVIVPVLGILIFIPVLVAAFGIDFGGLGISPLTPPANAAPWIVIAWLLIGVIVYFYLNARSPASIKETASTFIEA
jgi:amino acid transporter